MSYSEWLTRRTLQAPKYLDTRPHGDASQFTETVKRQATVVRGRGAASDFVGYNAGAAYSEGTAANTKGPQIEIGPVPPNPPSGDYGILTGFDDEHRLYYSDFGITGDFTVELFFKTSNPNDSSSQYLWKIENGDDVGMYIVEGEMWLRRSESGRLFMIEGVSANTWYHVAVTRGSGIWYTSVNGLTIERDNSTENISNGYLVIGDRFSNGSNPFYDGSISNFRVTESALYTTTYTIPPTPPLSSQGARLLLLAKQDAPFADSAGTNVAEGSCTWQAGPIPTIPPLVLDYGILTGFVGENILYYPTFTIPANFTVELFFRTSNTSINVGLWGISNDISMRIRNGNLYFIGILEDILMIPEVDENRWYHVAVSREGSTWYTSVDGSTVFRGSQVINLGAYLTVGDYDDGWNDPFEYGSISNFRISNIALYTENYIPTLPLGDEDAVLLLLAKPGDPFGDSAGTNVSDTMCLWSPGPILPLPSFSLFGILSNVNFDAGTVTLLSEFTVEFFANLQDSVETHIVRILKGNKFIGILRDGLDISVEGITTESATIPDDTLYYHYAICGRNGQAALYINGARATPFISYDLDADSDFLIGSQTFTGSLTNFRFTNGQALYGDVYQIPTLPLTRGDLLLLGKQNAITTDSSGNFVVTGSANWARGPISVEPAFPFELYGSLSGFSSSNTLSVNPIAPITGDFTIEAFVEMSGTNTQTFFSFGTFIIAFSGGVTVFIDDNSSGIGELPTGLSGYLTHFAISGNTDTGFGCYINGTRIGEYTEGITLSGIFYIGNSTYGSLTGSITNFRISNTAYSGQTIPIPSLPLSGGRFLLRCSPNVPYENSGTDQTIGTLTNGLLELAPILPPPPYQDYGILTQFTSNGMFYPTFGSLQDFTVEFFFKSLYVDVETQTVCYFSRNNASNFVIVRLSEGFLKIYSADGQNTKLTNVATVILDRWYHIALTRSGSDIYFSIDGITNIVDVLSPILTDLQLYIGSADNGSPFLGSISNFRVTISPLYTTDFAVPAPPLQVSADTRLLLLAKPGDRFKDSSGEDLQPTYTPGWTSGPIPLYPYYGVLEFTETDYLTVNPSPTLTDFTIEWFARPTVIQTHSGIFDLLKSGESIWCYFTDGNLVINENTNLRLNYPLPDALNNWLHYAICRSGGTTRVYVSGSQIAANIGAMFSFSAATLRIGFSDENEFKGSLTNFRISNTALYSGTTYTIPSLPLSGGQLLLLAKPGAPFVDSAGGTVTGTALSRLGPIDL